MVAGLAVGGAGGVLVGFGGFGWLGLLLIGFAVGEVVARVGRRRGGRVLAVVAFISAVVGPLLGRAALLALLAPAPDLSSRLMLGAVALVSSLLSGEGLFLVIAGVIASSRAH